MQYRLVTDGRTDGHTTTANTAPAWRHAVTWRDIETRKRALRVVSKWTLHLQQSGAPSRNVYIFIFIRQEK